MYISLKLYFLDLHFCHHNFAEFGRKAGASSLFKKYNLLDLSLSGWELLVYHMYTALLAPEK